MRRRVLALHGPWPALIGSTCLFTALPGTAAAQDQQATPPEEQQLEEVVVTGIRASLQSATEAKREATGFTDSTFSEDIGKFPDTNIAESFNRVPGITITRETSGEGLNIAIRGLGTNFTRSISARRIRFLAPHPRVRQQPSLAERDLRRRLSRVQR